MCSGIAKCTGSSIISHSNTIYGVSHSPHPSSRRSGYSTQRAQGGSPLRIGASYDYVPHQPTGMRETPYSRLSTPYGIALLIWKTSHPARFFLAFYSSYSSGTTPVYHGYSRDIHPPPILPAYPDIYGYATTINNQWVKVYLALCIVPMIWVSPSKAYASYY